MSPARTEDQQIQAIRVLLDLAIDQDIVTAVRCILDESKQLHRQLAEARQACRQIYAILKER